MNGSPQTPLRRALLLMCALTVMTALVLVLAVPAFAQEGTPPRPSALDPAGPNSAAIASLFNVVLVIAAVVFVVVEGLILVSAFRFRSRARDVSEPTQVHGNTKAEIAWTILPALIVVTLFVMALQTQQTLAKPDTTVAPEQMTVKVIGHQFWWEYQYPDLGINTATDLVIPTGKVVNLELSSADVIHQLLGAAVERQDRRFSESRKLHLDSSQHTGSLLRPVRRAVRRVACQHACGRRGQDAGRIRSVGS